ncbi:MAG TPA: hypothetical protein VFB38_19000 [Chthonomonadaceae bacterium]|nr:hypothetical protein [Chthonomonadaceae bacterium]
MVIRLSKGKNGKPGTLTCIREDGSTTWQRSSDFFAYHDLIHYAVETTLGYKDAFLGLVAKGRDLDSFGTRDGVKENYTQEEGWAEGLAGLVQFAGYSGGPPMSDAELLETLAQTCAAREVSMPPITVEQLTQIRAKARDLHKRWAQLPKGEALELTF